MWLAKDLVDLVHGVLFLAESGLRASKRQNSSVVELATICTIFL